MSNTKSRKKSKSSKEPDSYDKFIDALMCSGHIEHSASVSGLSESTLRRRRTTDSEFSHRWDDALAEFSQRIIESSFGSKRPKSLDDAVLNCDISILVPYLDWFHLDEYIVEIVKAKVVLLFQDSGMLSQVARDTGIPRQTLWRWIRTDPSFAADIDASYQIININLMDDLIHRAVHGTKESIIYHGEVVGERVVRSDCALVYALKHLSSLGYGAQSKSIAIPDGVSSPVWKFSDFISASEKEKKKEGE